MKKYRLHIAVRGAVQGVGFRPFIYRLATQCGLCGWVANSGQGVIIEAEGEKEALDTFMLRIDKEKPAHSYIQSFEPSWLDTVGYPGFEIRQSLSGEVSVIVLPDIATCPQCREEILDPENRRYMYPFTNCTLCGPRYSIINKLPYDRKNTSMKNFVMCDKCKREYDNPSDRRFHAQPNACPECGPKLKLWDENGNTVADEKNALESAADNLRKGLVLAVKGIGGFQLMVDARNEAAVLRLRKRKHREAKPFAIMYPDMESLLLDCVIPPLEKRALLSAEAPIVLVKKRNDADIAESTAPLNPYLGVMLPYSPLHILLMKFTGFPVVATSGNISEEPICIDETEALESLKGITDVFLVHDRPIVRHVDDSVVRIVGSRELVLRRARGFAPLPVSVQNFPHSVLSVGPHLKNTAALSNNGNIFLSQHIGDLETGKSLEALNNTVKDLIALYEVRPVAVASDAHPDYASTGFANGLGLEKIEVQHHYAHVLSCMADNDINSPVLGVSWDGTGYGDDKTVWGGEFLRVAPRNYERFAYFSTFCLPGGDKAVKEPRRSAIGLLYKYFGSSVFDLKNILALEAFTGQELCNIRSMLEKGVNCPATSSAGRIFDATASLIGLCQASQHEGQAAMALEFALSGVDNDEKYKYSITGAAPPYEINIKEMTEEIINDAFSLRSSPDMAGIISAKFHNTLVEIIVAVSKLCCIKKVVLTGGCFQNKYLTEHAVDRLAEEGFSPYWHQRVPPNDGGISLGQVIAAGRYLDNKTNFQKEQDNVPRGTR